LSNKQADKGAVLKLKAPRQPVGDEWGTPPEIIRLIKKLWGVIDTDPASNETAQNRIEAKLYFTKHDNGLDRQWLGNVFLNPPYSRGLTGKFVNKLLEELASGNTTAAILLVNNCADTAWFRKAARAAAVICFPQGRIKFLKPDGNKLGSPPRGQALLYFGPDPQGFKQAFRHLGLVGRLARRKSPRRG
jgi:ParB family chromosome partitioning protein